MARALLLSMNITKYLQCAGLPNRVIANEPGDGEHVYRFSFGAYGRLQLDVFADDVEHAFEVAVEWLDDHAPGYLVSYAEFDRLCVEAAEELGVSVLDECGDIREGVLARAETDLTSIGHTTLKTGAHIASCEWYFEQLDA